LLLLGLVIQVVKLLMIPLTILAVGAVVIVPIYLVTKHGKVKRADPPPPAAGAPQRVDDGIVSQDAVLQFLPSDVVRAVTQGQQPSNDADAQDRPGSTPAPQPAPGQPSGTGAAAVRPTAYRHGSCPVKHRTYEAAARCLRG
jgi:hypothetical protein